MRAKLEKASVVGAGAADEHGLHRRSHVVVNPAPANSAIKGEGAIVRVDTISCVSRK
jgi:hypothetical protein